MACRILLAGAKTLFDITGWNFKKGNKWVESFFHLIAIGVLLFIFRSLFFGMIIFHNSFLLPDNLKNTELIAAKVKQTNQNMKSFEIAYFNDKYLFVQVNDTAKKSYIQVLNFQDLLEGVDVK